MITARNQSVWVAAVITAKGSSATRATSIIKEIRWSVKPTTAKSFRLVQADEIRRERVRNKQRKQGAEVAGRRSGKDEPGPGRADTADRPAPERIGRMCQSGGRGLHTSPITFNSPWLAEKPGIYARQRTMVHMRATFRHAGVDTHR